MTEDTGEVVVTMKFAFIPSKLCEYQLKQLLKEIKRRIREEVARNIKLHTETKQ